VVSLRCRGYSSNNMMDTGQQRERSIKRMSRSNYRDLTNVDYKKGDIFNGSDSRVAHNVESEPQPELSARGA
jgi:hypothetical protein